MTTPSAPRLPIDRLLSPFREFARLEAASGILLLLATFAALLWANLWPDHYAGFFSQPLTVSLGDLGLSKSLLLWINDALMSMFFFIVGLEIKREVLEGELSQIRQAALPIAGALGGMIVPALIFWVLNHDGAGRNGWGIPMATDIAFAVGILALLGSRVPVGLKVFLTALAIADDIGAVAIIALFYTDHVNLLSLFGGGICLLLSIAANSLKVRHPYVYFIIGLVVWIFFLKSGVHSTIAAILMAFTIPVRTRIDVANFKESLKKLLGQLRERSGVFMDEHGVKTISAIESSCEAVMAPAQRLEHGLHGLVAFLVLPVFALANAGVEISTRQIAALVTNEISLGITLGLFLGKQFGIVLFSWLAIKAGTAQLPPGVSLRAIYGAATLGGIGFTMSLFIAGLALPDTTHLEAAKVGILAGSLLSGIVGFAILRATLRPKSG